jgi:hypothetical protein
MWVKIVDDHVIIWNEKTAAYLLLGPQESIPYVSTVAASVLWFSSKSLQTLFSPRIEALRRGLIEIDDWLFLTLLTFSHFAAYIDYNTANMVKKQPNQRVSLIATNNDAIAYLKMGELTNYSTNHNSKKPSLLYKRWFENNHHQKAPFPT